VVCSTPLGSRPGGFFVASTNHPGWFVVYERENVYGGVIVKKDAGEFTKYIAAIIAARWIRKTDGDKNAEAKNKQAKVKRDKQ